jgi:hypothetical protein
VKVGTVKVSAVATTFSNSTVEFNSVLSGGTSYVLEVDVKKCVWARSNIYWDGTQLTFVPAGTDLTKQGYQGVFFKWGSLVGVSPAKTGTSDVFSGSTPIYVPIVNSTLENSTWVATTGSNVMSDVSGTTSNWTTWGNNTEDATDIPYLGPSYNTAGSVAFGRDNRFVIDDDRNTAAMYQGFRGDICQYLSTKTGVVSGDYRMPTSTEFGPYTTNSWASSDPTVNPNADGWIKGIDPWPTSNTAAGYADGTADLLDATAGKNGGNTVYGSAKNRSMGGMGGVIFTASGYRSSIYGMLYVGNAGYCWSGSTIMDNSYSYSHDLIFFDSGTYPAAGSARSQGQSVRCVQN